MDEIRAAVEELYQRFCRRMALEGEWDAEEALELLLLCSKLSVATTTISLAVVRACAGETATSSAGWGAGASK